MLNLDNKSVICTGGNGFIGSNFIEYIFNTFKNVTIVNIDKLGIGSRELNFPNSDYKELNFDLRLLKDLRINHQVPNKIDYIFHFAAESHVDRSINSPSPFIDNNVNGLVSLLEYVRNNQPQARVINISTDEVFGHLGIDDEPFTENSNLNPRSPYSASKASADLIANSYYTTYGLDILTTRCCNNYGKYQHSEKFIPTIIRSLKNGDKIPVYGQGQNIREWIYVEDHNKSILEIAENGKSGMTYNIGSGVDRSNLELISDIIQIGKFEGYWNDHVEFVDDRKGHDFRYAISSLNYKREFELRPYKEAIEDTINHYMS